MPIIKTQAGQQVLKDRSVPLSQRQRSAFILFDGHKTVHEVLGATAPMGVTPADIDHLFYLGLLVDTQRSPPVEAAVPAAEPDRGAAAAPTPQERYAAAYPVAIELTSALGLRGFRLNLAVEAATSYGELLAVAPKILKAVGPERYKALRRIMGG